VRTEKREKGRVGMRKRGKVKESKSEKVGMFVVGRKALERG
jgi:hypothetical protein